MILSYKYPLYPNEEQEQILRQWLGNARFVYNHFLERNKKFYEKYKKFIFYNRMSGKLTTLKQRERYSFLKESPAQTLQQSLKYLDTAIKAVWKSKFGFPKFKSYDKGDSIVFPQLGNKCYTTKTRIFLPKMKEGILFDKYRPFFGRKKQIIVKREEDKFFVIIVCKTPDIEEIRPKKSNVLGIDVGTVKLVTTSDKKYKKPLDLTKEFKRIEYLQRRLEKQTKRRKDGKLSKIQSYKREETLRLLRLTWAKVRNKRKDYLHKLSRTLVKKVPYIVVEKLNIKDMTKSKKRKSSRRLSSSLQKALNWKNRLNKAILDKSWGMLFQFLSYKLANRGGSLIEVNPAYTSQTCSRCGCVRKKNRKDQAHYVCKDCGLKINADYNAAINIKNRGLAVLGLAS
jgi:putative transposase